MKKVIMTFTVFLSLSTLACSGFAPKNNLKIPVGDKKANSMTATQYNEVMDRIAELYIPIVKEKGALFRIERLWNDATVNAFASRNGDVWSIHMHGGIARHEYNSVDGLALVSCHEVGHHLGGAPKAGGDSSATWVTNEGQSDYFATMKCFRLYALKDDNQAIISQMDIPRVVEKSCDAQFTDSEERAICIRGAMAGYDLGRVLADISWPKRDISFDTPSRKKVWWTRDTHPKAQCRLDTYFQGALCTEDYLTEFDLDDPRVGACSRERGDDIGPRPRCWFRP